MEKTLKCNAYKFNKDSRQDSPPRDAFTDILDKAFTSDPLTRKEKDKVTEYLYRCGGQYSATFKRLGWAWFMPSAPQFKRILVSLQYEPDTFRVYYAPDKTSLRNCMPLIGEMFYTNVQLEQEETDMDALETCIES